MNSQREEDKKTGINILEWFKKNTVLIMGFGSMGFMQTYDTLADNRLESALRKRSLNEIIDMIYKDKVIDHIKEKDKEQDNRIHVIEKKIN